MSTAGPEALRTQIQGRVAAPGDPSYDELRPLYNAMFDKRPALIVECSAPDDVVAAVGFGRERGLDTAIRGGGHNGAGLGSIDDGLVIDLRGLKQIEIDSAAKIADVGGGCTWA